MRNKIQVYFLKDLIDGKFLRNPSNDEVEKAYEAGFMKAVGLVAEAVENVDKHATDDVQVQSIWDYVLGEG